MRKYLNNQVRIQRNNKFKINSHYVNLHPNHPYLSTAYIEPLTIVGNDIDINIYIADARHLSYRKDEKTYMDLIYTLNDEDPKIINNVATGEYKLVLSDLKVGDYTIELYVIDNRGIRSHELLQRFRVINPIKESEIWHVTDSDLSQYKVDKNNNSSSAQVMTNTRVGLQSIIDYARDNNYKRIILPTGTYRISNDHLDWDGTTPSIHPSSLVLHSGLTLDLNGSTIVHHPFVSQRGMMFTLVDTDDTHIVNGTLQGDYPTRDLTPTPEVPQYVGEFCGIISIQGDCRYTTIENVTIRDAVGYACGLGVNGGSSTYGRVKYFESFQLKDVDKDGKLIDSINVCTSGFADISSQVPYGFTMIGRFLGMRGQQGIVPFGKIHFYDADYNFIETKVVQQYRKVRIPNGSYYARASVYQSTPNGINLAIYNMKTPYNCAFRDVEFINTRTCSIAFTSMNNCLMERTTFDNCGQSLTPAAIDLEDGWQQQQDFTIRDCEVITPAGTMDLIVCAGYNIRIEGCNNFRTSLRVDLVDYCVTNCVMQGLQSSGRYERIYNSTFIKSGIVNGHGEEYMEKNYRTIVKNCNLNEVTIAGKVDKPVKYINCVLDYNNITPQYHEPRLSYAEFEGCIIRNYSNWKSWIGYGCKFTNCTFENIDMTLSGDLTIIGGTFTNCKFASWLDPVNITIKGVQSDDISLIKLQLNSGVDTITIENSNVRYESL